MYLHKPEEYKKKVQGNGAVHIRYIYYLLSLCGLSLTALCTSKLWLPLQVVQMLSSFFRKVLHTLSWQSYPYVLDGMPYMVIISSFHLCV
jgi:hypothetical protein